MFPPASAQSNLAEMHQRSPSSGELRVRAHLYAHALDQDSGEKQDAFFQSGGAGLFAKPKEYVKMLAAILNEGTSPTTGKQILAPESVVALLCENQIPTQYVLFHSLPPPPLPSRVPQLTPCPQTRLCPRRPAPRKPLARKRHARVLPAARQPSARLDVRRILDNRGGADRTRAGHGVVDGAGQLFLVG